MARQTNWVDSGEGKASDQGEEFIVVDSRSEMSRAKLCQCREYEKRVCGDEEQVELQKMYVQSALECAGNIVSAGAGTDSEGMTEQRA